MVQDISDNVQEINGLKLFFDELTTEERLSDSWLENLERLAKMAGFRYTCGPTREHPFMEYLKYDPDYVSPSLDEHTETEDYGKLILDVPKLLKIPDNDEIILSRHLLAKPGFVQIIEYFFGMFKGTIRSPYATSNGAPSIHDARLETGLVGQEALDYLVNDATLQAMK